MRRERQRSRFYYFKFYFISKCSTVCTASSEWGKSSSNNNKGKRAEAEGRRRRRNQKKWKRLQRLHIDRAAATNWCVMWTSLYSLSSSSSAISFSTSPPLIHITQTVYARAEESAKNIRQENRNYLDAMCANCKFIFISSFELQQQQRRTEQTTMTMGAHSEKRHIAYNAELRGELISLFT